MRIDIDVVATPCIRGRRAGNATYGESFSSLLAAGAFRFIRATPFGEAGPAGKEEANY